MLILIQRYYTNTWSDRTNFLKKMAQNTLMPSMLLLADTKTEAFTLLENKKQTQTERGVSDINQCSNPANKCYKMKNVFL